MLFGMNVSNSLVNAIENRSSVLTRNQKTKWRLYSAGTWDCPPDGQTLAKKVAKWITRSGAVQQWAHSMTGFEGLTWSRHKTGMLRIFHCIYCAVRHTSTGSAYLNHRVYDLQMGWRIIDHKKKLSK